MHSPFPTSNVQSKRDLQAAEDYYSRAISADPSDGETISEYARLEWKLHHDQEKALLLFEQAVKATPGDRYNSEDTSLRIYKMFCYFACLLLLKT